MKRQFPWMPAVAGLAFTALVGIVPVLMSKSVAVVSASVAAAVLVTLCVVLVGARLRRFRLHRCRGVIATVYGKDRSRHFADLWQDKCARSVLCWGVGMTRVVRDLDMVEATIEKRHVKVVFEMIDPAYVRANEQIAAALDRYYGRANFVAEIEHSLATLVEFRDSINTRFGRDTVRVQVVQLHQPGSGTIINPGDDEAVGIIEGHTVAFPIGQSRSKVAMYSSPRPETEPPVLAQALISRRRLPRMLVGSTVMDRLDTDPTHAPVITFDAPRQSARRFDPPEPEGETA